MERAAERADGLKKSRLKQLLLRCVSAGAAGVPVDDVRSLVARSSLLTELMESESAKWRAQGVNVHQGAGDAADASFPRARNN